MTSVGSAVEKFDTLVLGSGEAGNTLVGRSAPRANALR